MTEELQRATPEVAPAAAKSLGTPTGTAAPVGIATLRGGSSRARRETMRATVFRGVGDFGIQEVPRPRAGVGDAVIRVTLTTICGTDPHIVRGEYPVRPGLVIGHEPVG